MLSPVLDVSVNGDPEQLSAGTTVADIVGRFCASPNGVAVARNGDVVPKSAWTSTPVVAGDRVEIVTAAAGG